MNLSDRIRIAAQQAAEAGHSVHHVAICAADWPALPAVTLKPAFKSAKSVLWAMDAKGFALIPYPLGDAA
jgi:hypothetical protein